LATKVSAGDTLILFSGTYTDKPDLNSAAKHFQSDDYSAAVGHLRADLQSRHRDGGTDNRPYFSGYANSAGQAGGNPVFTIESGVTGVTLSYLRIRGATFPWDDSGRPASFASMPIPSRSITVEVWNAASS